MKNVDFLVGKFINSIVVGTTNDGMMRFKK